jgi:hypothetical protein
VTPPQLKHNHHAASLQSWANAPHRRARRRCRSRGTSMRMRMMVSTKRKVTTMLLLKLGTKIRMAPTRNHNYKHNNHAASLQSWANTPHRRARRRRRSRGTSRGPPGHPRSARAPRTAASIGTAHCVNVSIIMMIITATQLEVIDRPTDCTPRHRPPPFTLASECLFPA